VALAVQLARVPGLPETLLKDADPLLVREAAEAIRRRASAIIQQGPGHVKEIGGLLRETMTRLANDPSPAAVDARRAAGEALAVLKDPVSLDFARSLLRSNDQPPEIRGVALVILGELDPRNAGLIVEAIDPRKERDPSVRIRGMEALSRTRSFDQAGWLFQQLNEKASSEPNAKVRDAARVAYLKLLPYATPERLNTDAGRLRADPPLRIEVLKELLRQLMIAKQEREAAAAQENIGTEYFEALNNPKEGAKYLGEALAYFRGKQVGLNVTNTLSDRLIRALIAARQYPELTALAKDAFENSPEQDSLTYKNMVGVRVRNEAERLKNSKDPADWADAAKMLDLVLKMDPPLGPPYPDDLNRLATEVEKQRRRADAAGGGTPGR
jgi:hypothetical protein